MTLRASEIAAYLAARVVGQDEAVKSLAVAAAQHYARAAYRGDVHTKKANVVIAGPTGVGKTFLVRCLAECLDVPFAQVSAPSITQPGFTGLDPDTPLRMLLAKAGKGGRERAEGGIAYIDEVDKIARKDSDEAEKARNLTTGLGVQQALLDVLDAGLWTFADGSQMDAAGVLFIVSGAFVGIEGIVARRIGQARRVARPLALSQAEALRALEHADLISYGMIPEFVGRLPVLVVLRPLDQHELVRILTEPQDAPLRRLAAEFEGIGARLEVDPLWAHRVAAEAIAKGTGARALETILRPALRDAFYAAGPGDVVRVDAEGGWRREAAPPAPTSPSCDRAEPVGGAAPAMVAREP